MEGFYIYRITKAKWAGKLNGSGAAARWNPNGIYMCYTAESKPLACLEMLAHLQTSQVNHTFKVTKILVPSNTKVITIKASDLSDDWTNFFKMDATQEVGKNWVLNSKSCLLKVPSALMTGSYNYLINPSHPEFKKLKVVAIEDFLFDQRLLKTP